MIIVVTTVRVIAGAVVAIVSGTVPAVVVPGIVPAAVITGAVPAVVSGTVPAVIVPGVVPAVHAPSAVPVPGIPVIPAVAVRISVPPVERVAVAEGISETVVVAVSVGVAVKVFDPGAETVFDQHEGVALESGFAFYLPAGAGYELLFAEWRRHGSGGLIVDSVTEPGITGILCGGCARNGQYGCERQGN